MSIASIPTVVYGFFSTNFYFLQGKIYLSVGRKYSTGSILPSDGQIALFLYRAIRLSWRKLPILIIRKGEFILTLLYTQARSRSRCFFNFRIFLKIRLKRTRKKQHIVKRTDEWHSLPLHLMHRLFVSMFFYLKI